MRLFAAGSLCHHVAFHPTGMLRSKPDSMKAICGLVLALATAAAPGAETDRQLRQSAVSRLVLIQMEAVRAMTRHCVDLDPAMAPHFAERERAMERMARSIASTIAGSPQFELHLTPELRSQLLSEPDAFRQYAASLAEQSRAERFAGLDTEQQRARCKEILAAAGLPVPLTP